MSVSIELLSRRLSRRDARDVRGIIKASRARGDYSFTVKDFYEELRTGGRNAMFAARDSNGRVIGVANATVGRRFGKSWMNQVHPNQRNRGVATALLRAKVRWLLGNGRPVIVTIVKRKMDRVLTRFIFMGEQFRLAKPDWNTLPSEKRYVLDLRPAIERRVKFGGLRE
jgi:GNAT superfamily N-acetyltransferase